MKCKNKKCGNDITDREKKLNAGLCGSCFEEALRIAAREVAERDRRAKGNLPLASLCLEDLEQEPLDIKEGCAEDFSDILLPGLLGEAFEDQAQVLDVPAQGVLVAILAKAEFPVVAGTQLAVGLAAVLVHVLAEALLDEG